MDPVPIHFAKTHLSRLIQRAQAGEEVVIARGKAPVVRLVPVTAERPRRQFGAMRDRVVAQAQDLDVPLVSNETLFDGYGVRRLW